MRILLCHLLFDLGIETQPPSKMSYRYYEDLSGDSSDGGESESDDEKKRPGLSLYHQDEEEEEDTRCILFADVDCFYCQCEQLDRKLDPLRPLAIGQKHIIVTCNYAAREAGVSKLMLRDEAYRRCSHLLIVEGSDLERYRIHARKIYESFRRACQQLRPDCKIAKGSMDEMIADLSLPSSKETMDPGASEPFASHDIYVYGSGSRNNSHVMTEDQSGAQTVIYSNANCCEASLVDPVILRRLQETATLAWQIRQTILSETGFATTMGVSCNPLLSKLASGLRKPGTVNVLPPGRGARLLVQSMPLRKIPGVGSSTIKVLMPWLIQRHGQRAKSLPWTCG